MSYTVSLKRSAEKELDALPPRIHDKVIKAIFALKKNPYPRNVKRLHGREGARKEIEVFSVGDRKDVYRY
jgi:mRNA-degrading endonuclease RelE of RelBE toxin-antitoxin system